MIILIDNDPLIRTSWQYFGEKNGVEVSVFADVNSFIEAKLSKDFPIYIDSELDNGLKGEFEAKKLFELGHKEIYLATGYSDFDITNYPWIKAVVGKRFP